MRTVTKIDRIADTATKKKLRVAAYCRVSTDTDAQLESFETQKSHYENYIRSRDDWEFAGLYYDEGISGTSSQAPNCRRAQKCQAPRFPPLPESHPQCFP